MAGALSAPEGGGGGGDGTATATSSSFISVARSGVISAGGAVVVVVDGTIT